MIRCVFGATCCAILSFFAGCQTTPTNQKPAPPSQATIDSRADEALRAMSRLLAEQSAFSVRTESIVEQVVDGQKLQFSRQSTIRVRRPDRVHAVSIGDDWNKEYAFDGRTVTILDRGANVYSTTEIQGTIDQMFDILAERYGLSFPTCDLLYSNPYAMLSTDLRSGRYVGLHAIRETLCHHLAFSQDAVDWQIWIEASDTPWPHKLVVTYKTEPAHPQDIILFRDWKPESMSDNASFVIETPPGAVRTDLVPITPSGS